MVPLMHRLNAAFPRELWSLSFTRKVSAFLKQIFKKFNGDKTVGWFTVSPLSTKDLHIEILGMGMGYISSWRGWSPSLSLVHKLSPKVGSTEKVRKSILGYKSQKREDFCFMSFVSTLSHFTAACFQRGFKTWELGNSASLNYLGQERSS